jgi:hypothetical protein
MTDRPTAAAEEAGWFADVHPGDVESAAAAIREGSADAPAE